MKWEDVNGGSQNSAGMLLGLHVGSGGSTTLQPFELPWSLAPRAALGLSGQPCCLPSDPEQAVMQL